MCDSGQSVSIGCGEADVTFWVLYMYSLYSHRDHSLARQIKMGAPFLTVSSLASRSGSSSVDN